MEFFIGLGPGSDMISPKALLLLAFYPTLCHGDSVRHQLHFHHQLGSSYTENNSVIVTIDKGNYRA